MKPGDPPLIVSLGLMHTLDLIINASVSVAAAFIGVWFGAKFSARRSEKAQAALLRRLETSNSLSAIARRLPGGEAYAAVKQAEWRAERQKSKDQSQ